MFNYLYQIYTLRFDGFISVFSVSCLLFHRFPAELGTVNGWLIASCDTRVHLHVHRSLPPHMSITRHIIVTPWATPIATRHMRQVAPQLAEFFPPRASTAAFPVLVFPVCSPPESWESPQLPRAANRRQGTPPPYVYVKLFVPLVAARYDLLPPGKPP